MNLIELKKKVIKLINEYSNNGNLISDTDNADILLRVNDFADMGQKEIATKKKIHAVYSISQNPIPNQLGLLQGFDIVQFRDTPITMSAPGSKAYYFEVDRQCTVTIKEGNTVLETINVPSTVKSFTAYKGLITPISSTSTITASFSGSYPFNIRNRALYAYAFPSAVDVPDYRPYVKYQMPSDFMELNRVIHQTDPRQYINAIDYKWEGKRTFVVNYYNTGSYDIHYYKYPATITDSTLDTYELEIDTEAQEALPLFVAAKVLMSEQQSRSFGVQLMNEYLLRLADLARDEDYKDTIVQSVYGM